MTKFYKKKIKAYSEQRVIFEKFLRQLSYGKVRVDVWTKQRFCAGESVEPSLTRLSSSFILRSTIGGGGAINLVDELSPTVDLGAVLQKHRYLNFINP